MSDVADICSEISSTSLAALDKIGDFRVPCVQSLYIALGLKGCLDVSMTALFLSTLLLGLGSTLVVVASSLYPHEK